MNRFKRNILELRKIAQVRKTKSQKNYDGYMRIDNDDAYAFYNLLATLSNIREGTKEGIEIKFIDFFIHREKNGLGDLSILGYDTKRIMLFCYKVKAENFDEWKVNQDIKISIRREDLKNRFIEKTKISELKNKFLSISFYNKEKKIVIEFKDQKTEKSFLLNGSDIKDLPMKLKFYNSFLTMDYPFEIKLKYEIYEEILRHLQKTDFTYIEMVIFDSLFRIYQEAVFMGIEKNIFKGMVSQTDLINLSTYIEIKGKDCTEFKIDRKKINYLALDLNYFSILKKFQSFLKKQYKSKKDIPFEIKLRIDPKEIFTFYIAEDSFYKFQIAFKPRDSSFLAERLRNKTNDLFLRIIESKLKGKKILAEEDLIQFDRKIRQRIISAEEYEDNLTSLEIIEKNIFNIS